MGMILYEAMTENRSYSQLPIKELEKMMVEDNLRPKIPEDIDPELKMLIRRCWARETNLRPAIGEVKYELREIGRRVRD